MRIFSPSFNNHLTEKGLKIARDLEAHLNVAKDEFIRLPLPRRPVNDLSLSALWGSENSDPDREVINNVIINLVKALSNARSRTEALMQEKGFFGFGNRKPRSSCKKVRVDVPAVDYYRTRKASALESSMLNEIISLLNSQEVVEEVRNCHIHIETLCLVFEKIVERFCK
jgi:hypothetical protein